MEAGLPGPSKETHERTMSCLAASNYKRNSSVLRSSWRERSIKDTEKRKTDTPYFKSCTFCSGRHSEVSCTKFTSVDTRLSEARRQRLCFNCLGGHQVMHCPSKGRCRYCRRKHHSSICNQDKPANALNPGADTFEPAGRDSDTATLHSTDRHKTSVFLKTATATVGQDICKVTNLLFDEGSQRSYITQALAEELQLIKGKKETVQLASFGGRRQQARNLDSCTINLYADDGERLAINVLIVPTITVPLANHIDQVNSPSYLRGLKLAHRLTEDKQFNIELLIGADAYWDIVEDHTIRGKGPTAVKSKIGYLLSGPLDVKKTDPPCQHTMSVVTSSPKLLRESQPWRVSTTREEVTKDSNLGYPGINKRHSPFPEDSTKHQPQRRAKKRSETSLKDRQSWLL